MTVWRWLRTMLELIRFSHTVFALPFALVSATMATIVDAQHGGGFRWLDWVGILLCMVFARSTAMAVNRLADRAFDAANPRTANRHLPRGIVSVAQVAAFAVACAAGFVLSCLLFVVSHDNWLPLMLAAPVLLFICGYSYSKRFTSLSHFWLGASLMLAPIAAWIAIRGTVEWPPVLLGAAVLTWVAGFDIIYACQDVDFDRKAGLYSIPARLGVARALRVAAGLHLLTVILLAVLPAVFPLGPVYLAGLVLIAALLVYEHAIVRPDDLGRANVAFFHVNAFVSVGLLLVTWLDLAL